VSRSAQILSEGVDAVGQSQRVMEEQYLGGGGARAGGARGLIGHEPTLP
jgi:hypothetical protein